MQLPENTNSANLIEAAIDQLKNLINGHIVPGHGMDHFVSVYNHSYEAIKEHQGYSLTEEIELQILLGALLHDADDRKIFPNSKNNQNTRMILREILPGNTEDLEQEQSFIDGVAEIIDLVSCSKNHSSTVPEGEEYKLIVRMADRLEAVGEEGITRCIEYSKGIQPFHDEHTKVARTEEELKLIATRERYLSYNRSRTVIDHFYDKLLHVCDPENLEIHNPYFLRLAATRHQAMVDYVLNYWKINA